MARRPWFRRVLVVLGGLLLITLASAQNFDRSGPPPKRAEQEKQAVALRPLLNLPVKFNGFDDPQTKVDDVLKYLERAYNIPFDVKEQAFQEDGVEDVLACSIGKEIPRMTNVPLSTVLRKVLERIPASSGAMYFVRGGVVEITTVTSYRAEYYPTRPNGPFPPLVYTNFDRKPLGEALRKLAEDTDANILLDEVRAGDKAAALLTARLADVPLDTAVMMLADMAGLKMIEIDGVYYVTTKENVETLRKEQDKSRPAKTAEPMPKAEGSSKNK